MVILFLLSKGNSMLKVKTRKKLGVYVLRSEDKKFIVEYYANAPVKLRVYAYKDVDGVKNYYEAAFILNCKTVEDQYDALEKYFEDFSHYITLEQLLAFFNMAKTLSQ